MKSKSLFILLAGLISYYAFAAEKKITIPVNSADSMVSVFFGSSWATRGRPWEKKTGDKVRSSWKNAYRGISFQATCFQNPQDKVIFTATQKGSFDCAEYDKLVFVIRTAFGDLDIEIFAITDKGMVKKRFKVTPNRMYSELALNLDSAKTVKSLGLNIYGTSPKGKTQTGHMKWILLRNNEGYKRYREYLLRRQKIDFSSTLQNNKFSPEYKLAANLILTDKEGKEYRKFMLKKYKAELLTERNNILSGYRSQPEKLAFEYVGPVAYLSEETTNIMRKISGDPYCGWLLTKHGTKIARLAFILKDKELMRLACRYALSMCLVDTWTSGGLASRIPLNGYPHNAFGVSTIMLAICNIMEYAGEGLTPAGRTYLFWVMAQKGLAQSNYAAWYGRFPYRSNQLSNFARGRVAAFLMFEKFMAPKNHTKPYTDLAIDELRQSMEHMFLPDGSCMESSSYIASSIKWMSLPLMMYAMARNKTIKEVAGKSFANTGRFAEIVLTTNKKKNNSVIDIGDTGNLIMHKDAVAFMSAMLPNSAWVNIFDKYPGINNYLESVKTPFQWKLAKMLKDLKPVKPKSFNLLKGCGLVSSTREINGKKLKIILEGLAPGVGKRNYEIGTFIIEFAGDTVAGSIPNASIYLEARYHNILNPVLKEHPVKIAEQIFFPGLWKYGKKLCPVAVGDVEKFNANINLSRTYERKYLKYWKRTLSSSKPEELTICDEYKLGREAVGVNFIWVSYLPIKVNGNIITIDGNYGGKTTVTVPEECSIKVETHKHIQTYYRIIIHKKASESPKRQKLEIKVKFSLNKKLAS